MLVSRLKEIINSLPDDAKIEFYHEDNLFQALTIEDNEQSKVTVPSYHLNSNGNYEYCLIDTK